jgi:hypothetical protein
MLQNRINRTRATRSVRFGLLLGAFASSLRLCVETSFTQRHEGGRKGAEKVGALVLHYTCWTPPWIVSIKFAQVGTSRL